jgi:predicted amidohydrolase
VLLAQLAPRTHDVDSNVDTACQLVDDHPDAELAVFGELYLQSYALKRIAPIEVHSASGPIAALRDCARRNRTGMVVGAAIKDDSGIANAALCIDQTGEIAAIYRKVHLFGAETRYFTRGDEYVVVKIAGVALGVLICYDLDFPEAARAVAVAGAQLLVTASANMDPYAVDHALYARVRALENRLPHVYVNAVGQEGRLRFCGGSMAVDSDGSPIVELPAYEPSVRSVVVPLEHDPGDPRPDYLEERRPDVSTRIAGREPNPELSPSSAARGHSRA